MGATIIDRLGNIWGKISPVGRVRLFNSMSTETVRLLLLSMKYCHKGKLCESTSEAGTGATSVMEFGLLALNGE